MCRVRSLLFVLFAVFAVARVAESQIPASVVVRAETTALRATASMTGTVVTNVTRGTQLDVLGEDGSFYRVRVRGTTQEGFVPKLFVEAASGTPPAAPPSQPPPPPPPPQTPPSPPQGSRPSEPQATTPATTSEPASDRTYFIRPFVGLFNIASSTGVQLGGGVAGRPFSNEKLEIQGDLSLVRIEGVNVVDFSANVLYNFKLTSERFTPYGGAGLTFVDVRGGAGSEIALQILGGVEAPLNDRRAFRGELRIAFFDGASSLSLLAGLSF